MLVTKLTAVLNAVQGSMPGTCAGIQWQVPLQPEDRVDEQQHHEVEDEQRRHVAAHAHLARLVDAADAVDEPLHRAQGRVEERPLAAVDVRHVRAERLREEAEHEEEDDDLRYAVGHVVLSGAASVRTSPA